MEKVLLEIGSPPDFQFSVARTSQSPFPLPATSRLKNQTLTLDTKLHLDLTKLARPVCENRNSFIRTMQLKKPFLLSHII